MIGGIAGLCTASSAVMMEIMAATTDSIGPARIHDVDALRGFALLGILVVNITFMASGYPGNLITDPAFSSGLDTVARGIVTGLFSMKFYLLFSFLFGYSFTLQMNAADRAGAAFKPRMLRRILGLVLLGGLNIVFLYSGDVLTTYAAACLALFALRRASDRTTLCTTIGLYGFVVISLLASVAFVDRSAFLPSAAQAHAAAARETHQLLGGWGSVITEHLAGLPLLVVQAVSMQGPTALAMFLLGMLAGRRQLLANLTGREPMLHRLQLIGYPIGIAGAIFYALAGGDVNTGAVLISVLTAPLLTAAYVATLIQLMHRDQPIPLRAWLAPAGRIALTNYLGQSAVGLILFTGVGFGLAGTFSPPALLILAAAVFAGQLTASTLWLHHFRYGPAEWVLRWITNGQKPSWRQPRPGRTGHRSQEPEQEPHTG